VKEWERGRKEKEGEERRKRRLTVEKPSSAFIADDPIA
jgi:hypothetical protein